MKVSVLLALVLLALVTSVRGGEETRLFELRTYHSQPGKLAALHARFRDHTVALFEKHGMTNHAYWTPVEAPQARLVYLLSYPSREARDQSWRTFRDDPEWKEVYRDSTRDGKLVARVEKLFLIPTDYSPVEALPRHEEPPLYEMRRYTTNPKKLAALDRRFREHTIDLFEKHGLTNLFYFHLAEGQERSENTLIYFLAAPTREARDASFQSFSVDPAWQEARRVSEMDGRILVPKGVANTFLKTTDYSPVR